MRQLLATLCVTLFFALVALSSLRTLSFGRPHNNHGARFGYGYHIP
jgi:hypothetical protein